MLKCEVSFTFLKWFISYPVNKSCNSWFDNKVEQNNDFIIDSNLKLRPYEICFSNSSMELPLCHHQLKI